MNVEDNWIVVVIDNGGEFWVIWICGFCQVLFGIKCFFFVGNNNGVNCIVFFSGIKGILQCYGYFVVE